MILKAAVLFVQMSIPGMYSGPMCTDLDTITKLAEHPAHERVSEEFKAEASKNCVIAKIPILPKKMVKANIYDGKDTWNIWRALACRQVALHSNLLCPETGIPTYILQKVKVDDANNQHYN